MPATYAAARSMLGQTISTHTDRELHNFLDLAAGPETASRAALGSFPAINAITLQEKDGGLIQLGQRFAQTAHVELLKSANWECPDLTASLDLPQHDLLIPSYASGELGNAAASRLVQAAWTITRDVLVIIEPDTVPGFNRIQMVRDQLITLGAHVIAPCPTQTPARCPATTGAIFHSAWTAPRFIV